MKDTKELRGFLLEQMNGVAAGTTDLAGAKAIGNLAQQVYNTLNIEVKIALALQKMDGKDIAPVSFI